MIIIPTTKILLIPFIKLFKFKLIFHIFINYIFFTFVAPVLFSDLR